MKKVVGRNRANGNDTADNVWESSILNQLLPSLYHNFIQLYFSNATLSVLNPVWLSPSNISLPQKYTPAECYCHCRQTPHTVAYLMALPCYNNPPTPIFLNRIELQLSRNDKQIETSPEQNQFNCRYICQSTLILMFCCWAVRQVQCFCGGNIWWWYKTTLRVVLRGGWGSLIHQQPQLKLTGNCERMQLYRCKIYIQAQGGFCVLFLASNQVVNYLLKIAFLYVSLRQFLSFFFNG